MEIPCESEIWTTIVVRPSFKIVYDLDCCIFIWGMYPYKVFSPCATLVLQCDRLLAFTFCELFDLSITIESAACTLSRLSASVYK